MSINMFSVCQHVQIDGADGSDAITSTASPNTLCRALSNQLLGKASEKKDWRRVVIRKNY
jgi:hypothetical protein